jgi:AcrR family transcriptional regulator
MARKYNSHRRTESAATTRQTIVEAAIRLHGQGITTLSAVAEAAGVSLPTVNKYFPTREELFQACTGHVAANLEYLPPETLLAIQNPADRLRRVVREVYTLHEEAFGQFWLGYKLEDESPVLAGAIKDYEALVATLADTLPYDNAVGDQDTVSRFVRAALSPLTYRALRLKNGLEFEDAVETMTLALAGVLNIRV